MISNAKILITGATGLLARPVAEILARENEVWCLARFSDPAVRASLSAAGITTHVWDMAGPDLGNLPDDFTHVLSSAVHREVDDCDKAIEVNCTAAGRLMTHCRNAQAYLHVSNSSIYQRAAPDHAHRETDPLDGAGGYRPAYTVSKLATEGAVRAFANVLGLPTTIARMNVAYGPTGWGGVPIQDLAIMLRGESVKVPEDYDNWCMPIHTADIARQVPLLWEVASTPATVVNWGGDDMVTHREMMEHVSAITGVPITFAPGPSPRETYGFDNTRRIELVGRCEISWRDGVRDTVAHFHPELIAPHTRTNSLAAEPVSRSDQRR
ncbi:NAD-dependent epimerase/dehydratase family protein [Nocardioides massiliensis]|uniref:Nucleoside-diphosphate-sugar epimerase n=1 Tax=Nocardioides massiliensis TaxID=1325935 RepID=A0ABT9NK67_9ACTN|nr:NAD(P)-dependent oxidoreductase [Nocardioides massiliensis]MDP9820788.1 nucleoside-diphosphate-sugar epimerase [Nocardioides massiliensis]